MRGLCNQLPVGRIKFGYLKCTRKQPSLFNGYSVQPPSRPPLANFLPILRLFSVRVVRPRCSSQFSPCNKQREIRYSNSGGREPRKHGASRRRIEIAEIPFVRESSAKKCRFFVPPSLPPSPCGGGGGGGVWWDGVMMRATAAAWQKMQHLVRAAAAAQRR